MYSIRLDIDRNRLPEQLGFSEIRRYEDPAPARWSNIPRERQARKALQDRASILTLVGSLAKSGAGAPGTPPA